MAGLARLPFYTGHRIKVQLVLLPAHASDITSDTPAVEVIELNQGVTVRRNKAKSGSGVFILGGLALTNSKPAVQGFFVRGRPTQSIEHFGKCPSHLGGLKQVLVPSCITAAIVNHGRWQQTHPSWNPSVKHPVQLD
jgi:hypothetical protein